MKIKLITTMAFSMFFACSLHASQTPPSLVSTNANVPGQERNDPDEIQRAYIEDMARLNNQISDLNFRIKDASPAEVVLINQQIRDLTIELKQRNLRYQKSRLEQSQRTLAQGELSLGGNEKEYQEQVISRQQNDIARLEAELSELKNQK